MNQWRYQPRPRCITEGCPRFALEGFQHCGVCRRINIETPDNRERRREHQALAAIGHLNGKQQYIEWPFQAMRDLCGLIPLGSVVYVAARSGGGKTTTMYNIINEWLNMGYGVTVLPLEQKPEQWRLGLAAIRCRLSPDDAISGELYTRAMFDDEDGLRARQDIKFLERDLAAQGSSDFFKRLHVVDDETVDVQALEAACSIAKERGDQIVVVDHIDHVTEESLDRRVKGASDSVRAVNDAVLRLAKSYNLVMCCTSQLNLDKMKSAKDPIQRTFPPAVEDLAYPSKKIQVATQIIGLYRVVHAGASLGQIQDVRKGLADISTIMDSTRMGVVAMKLRFRGRNENKCTMLKFEEGRISDLSEVDKDRDQRQAQLAWMEREEARQKREAAKEAKKATAKPSRITDPKGDALERAKMLANKDDINGLPF